MATRFSTPDILGETIAETAVSAVMGHEPSVVVREYRWDGYGGLDEATRVFVRAKTDQMHDGANMTGRGMVAYGQALLDVESRLPRGQWGAWMEAETGRSVRQNQVFMNAARAFSEWPEGARISASALGLLASPSVSEELRDEVIQLAMEEDVTVIRTKEMIAADIRQKKADAVRRDLAVTAVMAWYQALPEKQKAEAIMMTETPRYWRTLAPYGKEAELEESEMKAAVKYVRANLKALVQQWGGSVNGRLAARAAEKEAGDSAPARGVPPAARAKAPERRPTGSWPLVEVSDETEDRPVRVVDEWIEVGVVEQEVLRERLRMQVTVTDAGEIVFPVAGGYVTLAAAMSGKDTVMMWRFDQV